MYFQNVKLKISQKELNGSQKLNFFLNFKYKENKMQMVLYLKRKTDRVRNRDIRNYLNT